jgi:hypothetical protein
MIASINGNCKFIILFLNKKKPAMRLKTAMIKMTYPNPTNGISNAVTSIAPKAAPK